MKGRNDMLTLGIRYLTGSVAASDVADRRHAEWPPHPGRVFMALAAAHFSTGDDPGERAALEWLETQPAPELVAPDAIERPVVERRHSRTSAAHLRSRLACR
jgi:CRISPR-associated protein Csb2